MIWHALFGIKIKKNMFKDKKTICVQGLGFVGFAMSVAIASAKKGDKPLYDVIGIDLPNESGKERINKINLGKMPFNTSDENLSTAFENVIRQGNLIASCSTELFSKADVIIVDINFDVNFSGQNPKVNFSPIKNAINSIGTKMKSDALVIIETTVPPGTTSEIIYPYLLKILKERYPGLTSVNLAHSYERVMPGKQYFNSITEFWRVYAGMNSEAEEKCRSFLETIINTKKFPLRALKSTTASETAKVLENSYRAANIAFINEWGLFAESIGIDLFEVLEAIRLRPTHSNIRQPGLGVGGYCLTKDPLMGIVSCKQIFNSSPTKFEVSKNAVEINHRMPKNTLELIKKNLTKTKDKSALILGLTYREDVEDLRYSPSLNLIENFKSEFSKITCHDPMLKNISLEEVIFKNELPNPEEFDVIVLAVSHSEYKNFNFHIWLDSFKGLLVDSNNILNANQIIKLRKLDLNLKVIGRGDI